MKILLNKRILNQETLFWFCAIFSVFLFATYIFSVNATVFNTVKRIKLEKEMAFLNHKISEMEFQVLSEKKDIDLELAYSLGFEEAKDVKFIPRKSVVAVLDKNNIQ